MDCIRDIYTSKDLYEDFFDTYGSDQYRFWQTIDIYKYDTNEEEDLFDKIYDDLIDSLEESYYRYQYFQNNRKLNMPYFDLLYDFYEETGGELLDLTNKELTENCLSEWAYDTIFKEDLYEYIEEIWEYTNEDASKIQKCFRNYKQEKKIKQENH
jgi:hypothetical protein